jgi:hypothetical protein
MIRDASLGAGVAGGGRLRLTGKQARAKPELGSCRPATRAAARLKRGAAGAKSPSMSYRARKRLALLVLVAGLPLYVMAAVWLTDQFERPALVVEFAIYVGLGLVWALPLRRLFLGLGRPDPDAPPSDAPTSGARSRDV